MSQSPIVDLLTDLVRCGATEEDLAAALTETELAALGSSWSLWCRPNQQIPPPIELSEPAPADGTDLRWGRTWPGHEWRVGLVIGGRGSGKSSANLLHAHEMAKTLEWPRLILCAQTGDKAVEIFVDGVLADLPRWERPWTTADKGGKGLRLVWPSGAKAVVTSAGASDIRGPEYYGAVCTEVIDWPSHVQMSTWNTILDATRKGKGQVLVDTTPSAGDPIVSFIKGQAEHNPRYWWIRHGAGDNALHVVEGYQEDQEARYGGTDKELEEIHGLEGGERGMVRKAQIEAARRHQPSHYRRRITILDPPYTSPFPDKRPDSAGVVSMGEGTDGQLYVTDDRSKVQAIETWAEASVELYVTNRCDCLVIETNRGGQLPTSMVRARAQLRGWHVVAVQLDAKTRHVPGTIYVKEVFADHDKWTRGDLLRDLYKAGRVSHLIGVDLSSLEKTLTGWYPQKRGDRSPGDLDAVAWGCRELAGHLQKAAQEGQAQITAAARAAQRRERQAPAVGQLHPTLSGRGTRHDRSRL